MRSLWFTLFVSISISSNSYAFIELESGAVESEVVNPGPSPRVNPLEKLKASDVVEESENVRNAVGFDMRWINGTVPYLIDSTLPTNMIGPLNSAIADFHKFTCIKLRPKTNSDLDWIVFKDGDGCSSYVGRLGRGAQPVTLSTECDGKGIVIHELMHAIGFGHEQCRPDRDDFIIVDLSQVDKDYQYNFDKYDGTGNNPLGKTFGFKYDFGSIMHYSKTAFSMTGKPTMQRKDGKPLKTQQSGFSDYDIKKINIYYGCDQGKPPAPQNEFTTTVMPPPTSWNCKKVVEDESCNNIARKCIRGYTNVWKSFNGVCTHTCTC